MPSSKFPEGDIPSSHFPAGYNPRTGLIMQRVSIFNIENVLMLLKGDERRN